MLLYATLYYSYSYCSQLQIKVIGDLEDKLTAAHESGYKKTLTNQNKAKAFNTLRAKVSLIVMLKLKKG